MEYGTPCHQTCCKDKLSSKVLFMWIYMIRWYSAPSLMRRYFEMVLSHGFAYGSTGTALHGKKLIISFTAGAPEAAYSTDGYQHYVIDSFIPQFRALSNLCGFDWQEPIISFGMMLLNPDDKESSDRFYAEAKDHAKRLQQAVC